MSPGIITGMPSWPDGSSGTSQMFVSRGDMIALLGGIGSDLIVSAPDCIVTFGFIKWINSNLLGANLAAYFLAQLVALCSAFSSTRMFSL